MTFTIDLYRATLKLFGHYFTYFSAAKSDINHLELIFREFIAQRELSNHPDIKFLMSDDAANPYVRDVFDPFWGTKSIHYQLGNTWIEWTVDDTPIPPLTVPPLAHRFLVLHGCSVQIKGRVIACCGPSFAGKSSLLLELLYQGAQAISDDLVVIEFGAEGEPLVWLYPKPVGIRLPTLSLLPWLPEKFSAVPDNCKLSFPALEGRPATTLTHLGDIFKRDVFIDDRRRELHAIYFLDQTYAGVKSLTPSQGLVYLLGNTCNSGFSREELASLCAQLVDRLPVQALGNQDVQMAVRLLL